MLRRFKTTELADCQLPSTRSFYEGCTLNVTILAQMRRYHTAVKVKGKVHPRRGHEDPWGKVYTSTLSLTSALNGGGRSTTRSGRFTHGTDPVSIA